MQTKKLTAVMATCLILASCGLEPEEKADNPPASTACADIAGTWFSHRLQAGSDGSGSWGHATETIGADCTSTQSSFLDSFGNTTPGNPVTFSLSSDGILTRADNASLKGMVMRDNKMIVFTRTASNGTVFRMAIWLKSGGAFSQADLAGTHQSHLIQAGAEPRWAHGTVTINNTGDATSLWTLVTGTTITTAPGVPSTMTLTSDGFVTDSLNASWHGKISADKGLLVATATMDSSFDLIVASPGSSATFTISDLAGTWRWHRLQTGSGHESWARGTLQSDSAGNVTPLSQENSSGGTNPGDPFTWTIDANGVITRPSDTTGHHGVLLPDKQTIISTRSSGDGLGYRLTITRKELTGN